MDEMERKLLEKAIRKRDLLARSIQRVCTQIESMVNDEGETVGDLEAAKIDRDDLQKKMAEFHELQSQIEMDVEDEDLKEHEEERTRIETIVRSAKIVLAEFIASNTVTEQSILHTSNLRHSLSGEVKTERKIKRPEIQIPKFEGDYRKWSNFKNVFESLVVSDVTFSNVEKMVDLKQAMQGPAADIIKKFEINDKNFEKAWEKLQKRYENRRATINNHLQTLTQLPAAKNENGVQRLLDAATDAIESLDAMGIDNPWPYMVAYLVTEKLDSETRKAWEIETVKEPEYPKFETLEAFLQHRVKVIESMGYTNQKAAQPTTKKAETVKNFQVRKAASEPTSSEMKCFDCQGPHAIAECEKFAAKPLNEKIEIIKRKGLCFQCLHKGHMVLSCRSPRCNKCAKRHHILLHVEHEKPASSEQKEPNPKEPESKKVLCTLTSEHCTYLPSALVLVSQKDNKKILGRALSDSCSEVNLVTEHLVKSLKCSQKRSSVSIETLSDGSLSVSNYCVLKIESRLRKFSMSLNCQVVPRIANNFVVYEPSKYGRLASEYADDSKVGGGKVDMLLGAEHFERFMLPGREKLAGEPYLRETVFGWVAIGSNGTRVQCEKVNCFLAIQEQLAQFFVLEEVGTEKVLWTAEERRCDEHYEATHVLDEAGFEVELPKELAVEFLGESRQIAFRQFCALERRLSEEEMRVYRGFMMEYIELRHMTLVPKPDPSEGRCYLPHHAVYKKTSTTSRMRSVFNASSPTTTGYSLNDILMKGPVLQEDLFSIMVRFRCKKIAFTADIEKMYRQVRVKKEDRKLQCILWRDCQSEPIRTYELNTVTYGTKPASYLATKCLSKIAEKYDGEYPDTATILRRDFYMDDCLTGSSSVEEARKRLQELRLVLGQAGFPLRKFASNSIEVLDGLDKELIEGSLEFESGEQSVGVLGLRWLTGDDCFAFYAKLPEQPRAWTKREILSEVSRVFDPLGLLAPVTVSFKIMLQSLWVDKVDWDEIIDGDMVERYLELREKLSELPAVHIPRFVGEITESEFHVFCDSSEKAFGAAVYMRHENGDGVEVRLVCAKTKVAPVKKVSLPRLELCGAVLAAKLIKKVKESLKFGDEAKVVAWTDSTIVLSWLAKPEHPWCTFVANRVTKVVETLPSCVWNHVKSQDNAADIISRGINLGQVEELHKFLDGPSFLRENTVIAEKPVFDSLALSEEKKLAKSFVTTTECWSNQCFEKFSSYTKIVRVLAYVIRFAENCALTYETRLFTDLSLEETKTAHLVAIRMSQRAINAKRLEKIDHFEDENGILRLRSRLANADLPSKIKYPVLMPKCRFFVLFLEFLHVKFFHANCLFLRNFLNLEYFALFSVNRLIRSIIYKCVVCRRYSANLEFKVPMGQLPSSRVSVAPAFSEVGVDFAGPFSVRTMGPSGNRGKVIFKAYVCVFVCMATRACHLEVAEDLSSKSFLDAFARFVSRRGMCVNVYSDHGTNFVGADRELRRAYEMLNESRNELERFAVSKGFSWHFIPPRAPNFGGLWEAAVKSFKMHFKKVVGSQILSFQELFTLTTQIESVLNSRPLCAGDASSPCFLSPAHLCIGRSLLLPPELPGDVFSGSQRVRYRLVRDMLNRFWVIWRRDYLLSLRKVNMKLLENRVPTVGELVLVSDESSAPSSWPLAKIVKLYPGSDSVVRVVDVRLGSRILRRPIIKLVPLLSED